ncbi:uncharacterized protein LOC106011799 [Aplysia californica]|uniref:Uncharacterized protein LOC106011799 n=1 Tax=Aplysia californica TaxID=6500 RepID=A0ABM1A073_APLCA|nr:uncharacterized protein LOC106011799 [Aplysia californica]
MIATLKSMLKVNTPTKQMLSMQGSADYREDKSLKMDGTLDVYRLLKKPANMKLALVKNAKKRGVRYDIDVILKSSVASGKLDSFTFIKDSGLLSTKTVLGYTIPRVAKNKITFGGKFNDRSTKAYKKYTIKSNLDIAKNPEYNLDLNVDLDHKKKHSEAEVELKYGPNPKDKTKRLFWSTSLNRKLATWKNAILTFKMNALAPAKIQSTFNAPTCSLSSTQGVDVSLVHKHQHTPKMIDSNVVLNYGGKGKDLSAELIVRDKSSKLSKINGKAVVAWPGSAYTLTTGVDQKSAKQYTHTLNLRSNSGMKHTITTLYKTPKGKAHQFSTKFLLSGMKPVTVSGSTKLDPRNFEVSGEVQRGKEIYGLKTNAMITKAPSAKVEVELFYPTRRMTLLMDGGKQNSKFNGRMEAAWDADGDKSQKVVVDGSGYMKSTKKSMSVGGSLIFNSPFKNYEDIMTAFKYGNDDSQHDLSGKFSWAGKGNQVISSLTVKRPVSLSNLLITTETKTPFKGFRVISVDIDHSLYPTLKTTMKGRWDKENGKLSIEGQNLGDWYNRNIKGTVSLKSTLKNAEDVTFHLAHADSAGRLVSNAALIHNGKSYGYDVNMDHNRNGWQIRNTGDLLLTMPTAKVKSTWKHRSSEKDIKSTMTSEWGKNRLLVDVDASHDLQNAGVMNADFKMQSPWRSLRNIDLALSHKHGNGLIMNNAAYKHDGKIRASSSVKGNFRPSEFDFKFGIVSPFTEDIDGKMNSKFSSYPMTAAAELSWAPRSKAVMEGSLNIASWDNANVDVKVVTPFREYRNIVLKASNKNERGEIVSHMNLDYGVRKNIDMESRMACNDMKKMLRLKMRTPFREMQTLDTGLTLTGMMTRFDGSADFEMVPVIGKLQGSVNWQYADDGLKGNLRVSTPFPEYPYIELSTSSQMKGRSRQSSVSAEYYPRQTYRLDSSYTLEMPYAFEATLSTPFPEYDNLGVAFQHNQSPSSVMSHGEVRYQPDKKIEGDVNMDWTSVIEGTVILKTPFYGYESNKVLLRHQGDMDAFSSHGEVNVAGKSVSADASFNSGYATTGTFTFNSPIPGLESVELSMNKKGNSNNMRGGATFRLNGDRSQANFNHRMSASTLKSTVSVNTPYSDNFKLSVDHNGDINSFTNKMSLNYGRRYDIDTIFAFDHRQPDVSGNGMIKYKLAGPRNVARATFRRTGELEDMSFSGTASYNRRDVSLNGSWKLLGGIEGTVRIATPFNKFRNIGATLSHTGDVYNFRTESNLNYMDNQNINGKMEMSSDGLRRIRFNTEMATPFREIQSAKLSVEHDYDEYTMALTGGAKLTTTIGRFGQGSVSYTKSGDLENFSIQVKGKYANDEAAVSVTKRGSMSDMTMSTSASLNGQAISMDGALKTLGGFDGTVQLKTPFRDYRNVGMKLTHRGEINDFNAQASLDYMDNKNVNCQIEFAADGIRAIRLSSEMNSPRELLGTSKMTFNHEYDTYRRSIATRGEMSSAIGGFGDGNFRFSKTGDLSDLNMEGKAVHNGADMVYAKITNSFQLRALKTIINFKSAMTPSLEFTVDHNGDYLNSNTKATGMLGSDNMMSVESTLTNRGDVFDSQGTLIYRTTQFGASRGSLNVHKEGEIDNFSVTVTGDLNGDKSTVISTFKIKDEITGSVSVKTPIRGYQNVGMSFKHSGNTERFHSSGDITLRDGNRYSAKLDFYMYLLRRIETTLEVRTPIQGYEFTKYEYRHESGPDSFVYYQTLEYGNSQKITYEMKATMSPNPDLSITLKTPFYRYEDMMASASLVNNWPTASVSGKVNAGNGNIFVVNGAMDVRSDMSGSLTIATPVRGFSDIGLSFQHSGELRNFNSEGRITYMDNKDISGKFGFKLNSVRVIAELKTPFSGYELTRYEYTEKNNRRQASSTSILMYGANQVIKSTTEVVYYPNSEVKVNVQTPFRSYEDMSVIYLLDTTGPRYRLESNVNLGVGRTLTLNGGFDSSDDVTGYIDLKTPLNGYRNIGMNFRHIGNTQRFNFEGKMTYADSKDISGKLNFYRYMWRRVTASAELSTPFSGLETTKAEVKYEDRSTSMSASSSLQYGNGQTLESNVKLTYSPNYDLLVIINTPFYEIRNVRAMATADLNAPSYAVTSGLTYGYNKAFNANGKLNLFSANKLDGSLEVKTPIAGFEFTKVDYEHKIDSSSVDGSASLTYENGRKLVSAELQSTIYPSFDASVTLKTPIYGYSSIQGSAAYDSSYNKYETSSSLKIEGRTQYTMSSGLDYSVEPMRVFTKVSTPYSDFRDVELVLTHEGQLTNFKTTGFLASPLTDNVNAQASLDYQSPYDMSVSASMKSSMAGMDDLKFEMKNSDASGEKKMNAIAGWTDGHQIQTDVVFRHQDGWYEDLTTADISMSTPFTAVRSLSVQTEKTTKSEGYEGKLAVNMNGAQLLDMSGEYINSDKREATVTFTQPWAMQYTASGFSQYGKMEADLMANWNRDELNSNVRVVAVMNDKSDSYLTDRSMDISVEHASRKMGVSNTQTLSDAKLTSTGKFYWDSGDEDQVSYDLTMADSSRRSKAISEASLKLGLPSRTLEWAGSVSDSPAAKTADATFNWDAGRDDTKQVGLKAKMTRGKSLRGDVTLSMPSIKKEIRVDGELMLKNGRIILDSKTDVSYSSDARKTLTLTSKVQDISDYYSNFNYSVELGLSHPYTNIDVKMNSHLGSSDERMTAGLDTSYLTASRQTKNLAMLAEINKIKKQISLQMFSPMNNIQFVGDVVSSSPSKLRLLNRMDGVETFRSDLTLDSDKQMAEISAVMGSDTYSLTALYPNSTAFRAFISHTTPDVRHKEALLAVRLNTTRLLHSRLAWRPDLWAGLTSGLEGKATRAGIRAAENWALLNAAVADEFAAKYGAVSSSVKEELSPLIDMLERELNRMAYRMNDVSRELRAIYQRNDFYAQDMGAVYTTMQREFDSMTIKYRRTYMELIRTLRQAVDDMMAFPARERYSEFVASGVAYMAKNIYSSLSYLEEYSAEAVKVLTEYKEKTQKFAKSVANTVYNATYVDYISNRVKNVDISPYITSFEMPEEYSNAIAGARSSAISGLKTLWERPEIDGVRSELNSVYQKGAWTYKYWNVEENLKTNIERMAKLLHEIVEDELKELSDHHRKLFKNPITVWAPEQGEIQAEIPLPFDLKRLDEMPDMSPLVNKAEKFAQEVAVYLPDQTTWENMKQSVSDIWPEAAGEVEEKEDTDEVRLTKYPPSRRFRMKKGGKKLRKYKM